MRTYLTGLTLVPSIALVVILLGDSANAAGISGRVVNRQGRPVVGVAVRAFRDGIEIAKAEEPTNEEGVYALKVDGGPIDFLEFRKPDWHIGLIENIHAREDNRILLVLYENPGGPDDFTLRYSLLLDYEKYFVYRTQGKEVPRERVDAIQAEIRKLWGRSFERLIESIPSEWTNQQEKTFRTFHGQGLEHYSG